MKKGWFSIGKSKEKKVKPPKPEKPKDEVKEKKNALYELFLKDTKEKKKSSTSNVYDASKPSIAQNAGDEVKNAKNKNKNQKSKDNNNPQQKKTVEQMINDLDEKEFAELITNIREKFPTSVTVWLSEAAFYFSQQIPSTVKDVLNVLNNNLDYPVNLMKESFKKELTDLFKLFTKEDLYEFQMSIIESKIPNIYLTQLTGPVGYLLFLQCLSIYLGQNSVDNVDRLASSEIRNKYQEKPNLYLTQVWCLQSVGFSNLKAGLDVWKKLYEPQLDHKYFYQFAIKYLQQVLNNNSNYKDALGVINVQDLMRILKFKAASEHQDVLDKLLPKLKLVCLSNLNDKEIASSFNELISNLNSFKNESRFEEFIVNCLVFCLEKNKSCFDIWLEYHKTFSSNKDLLLEHLVANPNTIQNQKKAFRSTLYKIAKFNDKKVESNYQSKDILKTMTTSKSCRSNLLFFLIAALLTYVAYDFRLNGSFERSNTARYLKRWHVYAYVQPVAVNIERNIVSLKRQYDVNYGPTVNSYVDQLVKKYDSSIRPTIDPYLGQVVNISTPLVNSVKENSVSAYRVAEQYYFTYSKQAGVFLEKNVFTGPLEINNLKLVINDTFEKLINAYTDVWRWASKKVAQLTN